VCSNYRKEREIGESPYECRKLVEQLALYSYVYAFDVLGFGLSDLPNTYYSGENIYDVIVGFSHSKWMQCSSVYVPCLENKTFPFCCRLKRMAKRVYMRSVEDDTR